MFVSQTLGTINEIIPVSFFKTCLDIDNENNNVNNIFQTLNNILEVIMPEIMKSDLIIIEKQLSFNKNMTIRVEQHTVSYIMGRLKGSGFYPRIIGVDPKLKTKMLYEGPGLNERAIKQWSVVKARELLTSRNDLKSLAIMDSKAYKRKQDDLADTVCQIEAFFKLMEWA